MGANSIYSTLSPVSIDATGLLLLLTVMVGCPKVVNIEVENCEVFIGRPSKWGNPYKIGSDYTREQAIKKYSEWILEQSELLKSLSELKGKTLGCYCKPKMCHGDVLLELANR